MVVWSGVLGDGGEERKVRAAQEITDYRLKKKNMQQQTRK